MDNRIKVLVVEDEVIIADNLCDTLEDYGYFVYAPAINYTEAIQSIENEMPDIAVLDIQLSGKKSGIDLGLEINEKYNFPFVFLTSNSDKVTLHEAKRVEPFAFLVKPFGKEELYAAIELALYNFSKTRKKAIDTQNLVVKDALFIKHKQLFIRIDFSDILYIKSDNVYLDIHLVNDKKYTVRATLNEYIEKLSSDFVRSHRSHIINTFHLKAINSLSVTIGNIELPVGKKHREDLLDKINIG